jgi:hypothetical protein
MRTVARVIVELTRLVPQTRIRLCGDLLVTSLGSLADRARDQPRLAALADKLCRMRVLNVDQRISSRPVSPSGPEVTSEGRRLVTTVRSVPAVGYDAEALQRLAADALPPGRKSQKTAHLWFTARPLMAWDDGQGRYRLCLRRHGHPAIISIAAIQQVLGLAARTPGHPRFDVGAPAAEVMTTYALEAILHALGGDLDCNAPRCRLCRAVPYRFTASHACPNGGLCPGHLRQLQSLHLSPATTARCHPEPANAANA